jgi:Cu(I)/Ag(I) efflux system membrane fusion protein
MFARVSFAPNARRDVLLVPSDAVIRTGRRNLVMEALADGRFAPVEVELGAESGGQTEIRKGLAAGRKVVVSGQFLIDSEASLKGFDLRTQNAPVGAGAAMGESRSGAAAGDAKSAIGQVHRATGKVESIDEREVTLAHGPVASLKWPSMTMAFRLPAGRPKNVAPGSTVQFEFRQAADGEFEIVTMAPAAGGASPTTGVAPAPAAQPARPVTHGAHQ